MTPALRVALSNMLILPEKPGKEDEQRQAILYDLLWKLVRKDYHGVADCSMDLRELHL